MSTPYPQTPPGYVPDGAWHAERARLDSLTSLYDPGSLQICDEIGVGPGWACADVGAGTGSLAQALAKRVAPSGGVVAFDIDTRFLEPLAAPGLVVRALDVTQEALPESEFDFVHARLLLEHLPRRAEALSSLVEAAKPGGWVMIEDFDWCTAPLVAAILDFLTSRGYDRQYGRSLPRQLRAAGLTEVGTRAQAVHVAGDVENGLPQWELLAAQLAPALIGSGALRQEDLDRFHELWHDPQMTCFSPLMVSCWGRRPDA
jgi:SAM-dependent methyltransferase